MAFVIETISERNSTFTTHISHGVMRKELSLFVKNWSEKRFISRCFGLVNTKEMFVKKMGEE